MRETAAEDLQRYIHAMGDGRYGTVLADPPWRFLNRTGKVAPEHGRLSRYSTMHIDEIKEMPVGEMVAEKSHLYLWVPKALLKEGFEVLEAWGFTYKTTLVWHKIRKDGGPDGRGVGFYFRNTCEFILFGVKGNLRTHAPARSIVDILRTRKREHSRKPASFYRWVENRSKGPYLELYSRTTRPNWTGIGNQAGLWKVK